MSELGTIDGEWCQLCNVPLGKPMDLHHMTQGHITNTKIKALESQLASALAEVERLKAVQVAGLAVCDELGVHPAQWIDPRGPEFGYTERTPEMEEHNRKVVAFFEALAAAKETK